MIGSAKDRVTQEKEELGVRYMDPPDGGDVPISEQVSRMKAELAAANERADGLARNLAGRDLWIVERGLWSDFVRDVEAVTARAEPRKEGGE